MTEYKFSEKAYAKMIFHSAKYPHLAVNGILLAEQQSGGNIVRIADAIPLFHQCLHLTPMTEIALQQMDMYAERQQLLVAGYYAATDNFNENSVEKAPALKIADKIQEHYEGACVVILDNRLVCMSQNRPALQVFSYSGEGNERWTTANFTLAQSQTTLEAVSALLRRGAMRDIVDFDNHLDNPEHDWTNQFLNKDLQKIMAMY